MRVLIGGIGQETNMFTAQLSEYKDFTKYKGQEIRKHTPTVRLFEQEGIETILNMLAWSIPAGMLSKQEFQKFISEFFEGLRDVEQVDGIYLILHGAMYVEEIGSGEEYLIKKLREKYGYEIPIAASFDFHGNMKKEITDLLNYATAYRTAPHIDELETRTRAILGLIRCLKEKVIPRVKVIRIPIVLPGEKVITEEEPCRELISLLDEAADGKTIWDVSLLCGYAWANHDYMTMSVTITYTQETERMKEVIRIAKEIWERRKQFTYADTAYDPETAAEKVRNLDSGLNFLSDTGDNVTAGASGDSICMLNVLLKHKVQGALIVGIVDREFCEMCRDRQQGEMVESRVGASLEKNLDSIVIQAEILRKGILDQEKNLMYVLVHCQGNDVLFLSNRYAFTEESDFEKIGIAIRDYHLVVIKLGYLYPDLQRIADQSILALTPGNAYQIIEKIPYNTNMKFYPRDTFVWEINE